VPREYLNQIVTKYAQTIASKSSWWSRPARKRLRTGRNGLADRLCLYRSGSWSRNAGARRGEGIGAFIGKRKPEWTDEYRGTRIIITIATDDLDRGRALLRGMGLTRMPESPTASPSSDEAAILGLFPRKSADRIVDCVARSAIRRLPRLQHTSDAEVDEVLAMAQKAGGRIVKPAGRAFWGGCTEYFADADGHVLGKWRTIPPSRSPETEIRCRLMLNRLWLTASS